MDLRARVTTLLGVDRDAPIDRGDLLEIRGCGALLALLDDLRRTIQGLPLVPTDEQYGEWRRQSQDDTNASDQEAEDNSAVASAAAGREKT